MTYRIGRHARKLRGALMVTVASLTLAGVAEAQARRNFDIPPQDAASSLQAFARQSGRQILFPYEAVAGKRTPAVRGEWDEQEALERLVTAAGLVVTSDDGRTITLGHRPNAQPAPQPVQPSPSGFRSETDNVSDVVVVGSRIQGARPNTALPVTVLDQNQIAAIGATSGDALFRSIPQAGNVEFNENRGAGNSNFARGDVGSINLRSLGTGNTLVLLNDRRLVVHPGTQSENSVPVTTFNTNALPVSGLQRVEILRDGAGAIYGADAVAGVVNVVLDDRARGLSLEAQHGGAEGATLRESSLNLTFGRAFNSGATRLTGIASFSDRQALVDDDLPHGPSYDRRDLVSGTPFDGHAGFDFRSNNSGWGVFQLLNHGVARQNGAAITSATGAFHIQPTTNSGCNANLGGGVCLQSGARSATLDRNLRYDPVLDNETILGDLQRANAFLFLNHDFADGTTLFAEAGYYRAVTEASQGLAALITAGPVTVPRNSYYNPFGPLLLNGQANPNRLPGLDIPAAGLDVTLRTYALADLGPLASRITNDQYRVLLGLKGEAGGYRWETAALYSEASTRDVGDFVSYTRFQQALALSTPDAYNPFNGGDPANPSLGDATPSSAAARAGVLVTGVRRGETSLALWDARLSHPMLLELPAGPLGFAAGVELRRETFLDDRDPRVDGTIGFTDSVTGVTIESDILGVSPTNDTQGARTVGSAYVEFSAPLVSPEMGVPLVRQIETQVAARYERFSDVGGVLTPKAALAWDVVEGVRLRASYSEGFRAPNLEQINATVVQRNNTRTDYAFCEADLRAGRIASFTACGRSQGVVGMRGGNPDLEPETSTTTSFGAVLEPAFLPPEWGRLLFTVDYWEIDRDGVIGLFGDNNALALDYLLRTQGSSNPAVVRADPTTDDIAAFVGTGLAPAGRILHVADTFVNLAPFAASGIDYALSYRLPDTRFGRFEFNLNVAQLRTLDQKPASAMDVLLAAQANGEIDRSIGLTGANDLIAQNGSPEWKWSAALSWNHGAWAAGLFTRYVGAVDNTAVALSDGSFWSVDDQITVNMHGDYSFEDGWAAGTRVRLGVQNMLDAEPPLAANKFGYQANLHQPYGRYWYVNIRKVF